MFCMMIFFPISSGMFMSASEDNTGILDQIDTKIAKATMIPKTHGEVVWFEKRHFFCSPYLVYLYNEITSE